MWTKLVALSAIISITFSASNVALPYFLMYLKGELKTLNAELLNASKVALEFGALTSTFMGTRVVIAFLSGYIAERIGMKRSVVVGLILYLVSGIWLIVTENYWEVLVSRALQGVASAMVWPVAESMIVEFAGGKKTRALMLYVMAFNVGMILGPAVGGAALQASSSLPLPVAVRVPFALLPLGALAGLLLIFKLPDVRYKTKMKVRELHAKIKSALYVFFFNAFANGFSAGIFMSVLIIYIMQYVTSVPIKLSSLVALSGLLGMALASPLMKRLDEFDFTNKLKVAIGLGLLHKLALAAVGLTKSYFILLAILTVQNFAITVVIPLIRSLVSDLVPRELTAKVFGMQQAYFNLGMIVGPLVGAALYKWLEASGVGGGLAFPVAAALGAAGVLTLLRVDGREVEGMKGEPVKAEG
ncbi:MFS transporter [Ignicoccus hospitalis]|uniref:Major facilitator superfamily MFS_1 n=1 Tax=Ignicoccus hospitalis (strain KIN4/I / DSM 18386 / JCM 14125) TaxID=453591 RepID=A8A9H2_IGNH4|nr:MFS transporter [Ignicoccus hospitalis]ABU81574.1 major facilitator superfamily MFS_1 [Ignicoccus hospitalis KIN4/I]HIH90509.1 MFS transporter [Desulfurococcaceae archaeon]